MAATAPNQRNHGVAHQPANTFQLLFNLYRESDFLTQIARVGPITALTFILTIGARFLIRLPQQAAGPKAAAGCSSPRT